MGRKKSKFVSILGWSLFTISGIFLIKTSFGDKLLKLLFPSDIIRDQLSQTNVLTDFSIFSYVNLLYFSITIIFVATFVISIFFLRFKNWARKGIMILLATYLIFISVITVLIWAGGDFIFQFTNIPANSGFSMSIMMMTLKIFATIFNIALFVFIFWLIDKCNSDFIKKKFI